MSIFEGLILVMGATLVIAWAIVETRSRTRTVRRLKKAAKNAEKEHHETEKQYLKTLDGRNVVGFLNRLHQDQDD